MAFAPYGVVGIVHLVAMFTSNDALGSATKPLLMPALLLALLVSLPRWRSGIALWGGLGIVFSWFGDTSLMYSGDVGFLSGLGFFLLAHVFYLLLIWRTLRRRRMPKIALVYVLWWIALIVLLAPHVGWLVWPLAVYGLVLGAMAASGLTANTWVAVGGAFFVLSDSVLGLNKFLPGFELEKVHFVIMASYILGQGLIAFGAVRAARIAGTSRAASPSS